MTPTIAYAYALVAGAINIGAGLVAQAAPSAGQFTPWVDAGGSAALVAAIIYIAKKVSAGDLVARPVAEIAKQQEKREEVLANLHQRHSEEMQRTIDKLREIIEEGKSREDALRALLLGRGQAR